MFSEVFGYPPSGKPMAEIWFGTHHGSPAYVADGTGATLLQALDGHELPFLVKFLGIAKPLSMQVHPTMQQAQVGFASEEQAGISLIASDRNYKDDHHKPEMVIALQDNFQALCGFRPITECIEIFSLLATDEYASADFLAAVDTWRELLQTQGVQSAFTSMMSSPHHVTVFLAEFPDVAQRLGHVHADVAPAFETALLLMQEYPHDAGVLTSLLMNNITINRGEALFLPAGNIHAYLFGLALEVMAASDNVIRGGLTPKHIDVDELLKVVDFSELPVPHVKPQTITTHVTSYPTPVEEFTVTRIDVSSDHAFEISCKHEALLVCSRGTTVIARGTEKLTLSAGHAAYANEGSHVSVISGDGELFVVSVEAPSVAIGGE